MGDDAERQRAYRDRKRGRPPRQPKPCGTWAAAQRHRRRGEQVCGACETAEKRHNAEQYEKRKGAT
jgi:hypothetical protein